MKIALTILLATSDGPKQIAWPDFVTAVAHAESGMNHRAIGKRGERGAWQFTSNTWTQYNMLRHRRYLEKPHLPFSMAADPIQGHRAADFWLQWIRGGLAFHMGRPPTAQELYAAWNLGLSGFARRKFDVNRVPKSTKAGIERLTRHLTKP